MKLNKREHKIIHYALQSLVLNLDEIAFDDLTQNESDTFDTLETEIKTLIAKLFPPKE